VAEALAATGDKAEGGFGASAGGIGYAGRWSGLKQERLYVLEQRVRDAKRAAATPTTCSSLMGPSRSLLVSENTAWLMRQALKAGGGYLKT